MGRNIQEALWILNQPEEVECDLLKCQTLLREMEQLLEPSSQEKSIQQCRRHHVIGVS